METERLSSGQIFVFSELVGPTGGPGRTISFTDCDIKPLGYNELAKARLHEKITIPLEMLNSSIVSSNLEGVEIPRYGHFKMMLKCEFTSKAIGLIRGGWLPSGLAAHRNRTVVLVDRNVVTEIVSRFQHRGDSAAEPDFLDIFEGWPVQINPLLYAMEGNIRSTPTPDIVAKQLTEVSVKLKRALPQAKLRIGPDSLQGILSMIENARADTMQSQEFLLRIAPKLNAPVSKRLLDQRLYEVLSAAEALGIARNSLVVIAAISSIAVPRGASPARAILKFKDTYTAADAYNAVADLRALELLIGIFAAYPSEITQLCTGDRNLALFWVGIQASNFTFDGSNVSYEMRPVEEILPTDIVRSCYPDMT